MIVTRKTICPLDCPDGCAILVTVENDVITKLTGDPDHGFTKGFLCQKMRSYHERVQSDSRVLYPHFRTGKKGHGEFKRISWDEAWDVLTSKLQSIKSEHGGEALLPFSYAGNMGHVSRAAGYPFFHKYGASRSKQTICSAAAAAGWKAHCGSRPGTDPEKAEKADLVVAWGINVRVTNIHFWPIVNSCRKSGGKLLVIDPYRNKTAKSADHYIQVNPGGDTALALGALKGILEAGKENRDFISGKTTGFEELRQYARELSWKTLEEMSGLSKKQMLLFAETLYSHPKAFFRIGIGLTRNTQGAMAVRAITCLAAALGLMDGNDGKGVLLSSGSFQGNSEKLNYSSLAEKETRQINMIHLGQALNNIDPKVYALFVYNANPLSVAPDSSSVLKGLEREDLFTVVHEQVMTPTARYADLLLPATTSFENADIYTGYGHFFMGITAPVISPRGESVSNFDLFQTLAEKMGYTDPPFAQSLDERIIDYLDDLKGLPEGFDPSSIKPGDIIKSTYSEWKDDGYRFQFKIQSEDPSVSPIPCLISTREFDDPDLKARYPLKLITPPNSKLLNSTFGDRFKNKNGKLLIHPDDAFSRRIEQGDQVRIKNGRGFTVRDAVITAETRKGLVVAEGIYWGNIENNYVGI
ncbi:molybdopterin-dependent oxidoreductase, partial [bacterium]|nr:molybdopterin-dependent oxidoreductase [bacterium]